MKDKQVAVKFTNWVFSKGYSPVDNFSYRNKISDTGVITEEDLFDLYKKELIEEINNAENQAKEILK